MDFKVSVIIPVYNADAYLRDAVRSAVDLAQVGEVILVEDGSAGREWEICNELQKKYPKVNAYQHPGGRNLGAAASRNLGIQKARFEFIAFLDADDWYLPNRFAEDKKVFEAYPQAEAVYSVTSVQGEQKLKGTAINIRARVGWSATPRENYAFILKRKLILHNTDGCTFKKESLCADKLFDERLSLHQDSELWRRLQRRLNYYPGEIKKPVAVVRRHETNRITSRSSKSKSLYLAVFIDNVGYDNLFEFERSVLIRQIIRNDDKSIENRALRHVRYFIRILYASIFPRIFFRNFLIRNLRSKADTQI